jgi:trimethylamine--corrinoid protein Co-methyltransferase
MVTASPEQLVIDNEILSLIFRAVKGVDIGPEKLATDLIMKVGPGRHFLGEEQTRRYYASEHYVPKLADRNTRGEWARTGSKDMIDRSRAQVEKILKEHTTESLDESVKRELARISTEADQEIIRQRSG